MSDNVKQRYNTDDLGFDKFLNKPSLFSDTPQSQNVYSEGTAAQLIVSGDLNANLNVVEGCLQSSNYVADSAGWMIDGSGNAEFETGYFRGDITGASGTFTGTVSVGSGTDFDTGYDPTEKVNTFAQDAIPTSIAAGDLWVDTNDSNKLYRAASAGADQITAGEWILVNDERAADAVLKAGTGQTITGNFNLNSVNVLLDGANKRIVINDGTNDRILLGYLSGKF